MSDVDSARTRNSGGGGGGSTREAVTPASSSSRKRPAPSPSGNTTASSTNSKGGGGATPSSTGSSTKRSKATASNRGLRHFSMMVCKKVEQKGTTTYNEVADELVRCVAESKDQVKKFDEKNIRRRVYDALNVLMAMDIISKDKKEITWRGLPNFTNNKNHKDIGSLKHELNQRREALRQKKEALRELLVQQVCFRNLVMNNARKGPCEEKIPLPFIVVNTHASSVIQCDMSRDRTNVMFEFSRPFEINDDNTILKKMGM